MKARNADLLPFLALLLLLVTAAFTLVSLHQAARTDRKPVEKTQRNFEERESPPEDWFIAQRVTHGGIPAGALEKAAAQAAALSLTGQGPGSEAAAARWRFAGPTNIGGRVVDIAVDPAASDTIYVAAATGGVWKSKDAGSRFTSIWPAANPQSLGALIITSNGTLFAG